MENIEESVKEGSLILVEARDSGNLPGWAKEVQIEDEENIKVVGFAKGFSQNYLHIAQAIKGKFSANVLRIPKSAIVKFTILISIILVLLITIFTIEKFSAIKDAILAYFP